DLRGQQSGSWDSMTVHLRFRANAETFERIRPRFLTEVTSEEYESKRGEMEFGSAPWPAWWGPPPSADTTIYLNVSGGNRQQSFASEWIMMAYNPRTADVWYYFSGVD